ncbi:helix-turn-helix domain-containing protein [Mangrovivirga cuniculi]|uniref:AraC family transcriptional regulator n=1 Tax=Mangrovivirga cuniculi TaxID=2715131 RepID=A0A4D7JP73_9BACT|nr:helix-turn-helix domain-containing protein [Mangrovivirga cuniculi]QCK15300.1 AraC family transcriptional regulator [Mangrovivirga cuniculi]
MSFKSNQEEEFIEELESIIMDNISDEQFGVSELAESVNMSRSNLLRKIKKYTNLSASQFIRQVRLNEGMKLLKQSSMTVSEISYKVGFSSTSYFIKCFREQFGYAPGESRKDNLVVTEDVLEENGDVSKEKITLWPVVILLILIIFAAGYFVIKESAVSEETDLEKSIAVLPFKNESVDSSNLYFVNGLMESTLNTLQKVGDLRVVSRTSVEQYRDSKSTIPEIAEKLNVNYILEGSGQKVEDRVSLNIKLIRASDDQPVWTQQYNRKVVDIFSLQNEIATEIANAIKVIVKPTELEQIQKKPTENLEAYDYYLKALDPYNSRTKEGLVKAIPLLKKAVEHDPQFALAYADLAISYYFLDIYQVNKKYTEEINNYADKALLYDPKMAESLIAKALYYMHKKEYRLALPHLEKALEYNPNSTDVVQILSDFYARVIPDTEKYLEYALKGVQLKVGAKDSSTFSYTYLHLSNALIQAGFIDQSIKYINLSLAYNPDNYYSPYVKSLIMFAKHRDIEQTQVELGELWRKDTSRLDILQEYAKMFYFQKKYDSAFYYYEKFVTARKTNGLEMYTHDDIKVGWVYEKMGHKDKAAELYKSFADYLVKDNSIYNSASMAVNYTRQGKYDEAIEQLKVFSNQDNYQYWIILFFELDPIIEPLKSHPEFKKVVSEIKNHFWDDHDKLKEKLENKGLI